MAEAAFLRRLHLRRAGRVGTNKELTGERGLPSQPTAKCKGPEAGTHGEYSRDTKKMSMTGME